MDTIYFDKSGSISGFEYSSNGESGFIEYYPSIENLEPDINIDNYVVELLINPMLSNESDVYFLSMKSSSDSRCNRQTIGAIVPILALDSDQEVDKFMDNYLYVAFWHLLKRLKSLKSGGFSDNFESNICVCIFSKKLMGDNPLYLCIHSLRKYGYSYFEDNNNVLPIEGYSRELIISNNQKSINIELKEPILYQHPIVDRILRDLKSASNVTHRFVLLYQIIELLMEDAIIQDVDKIYNKLQNGEISTNDYFAETSRVSKEKERIRNIFKYCNLQSVDCKKFRESCRDLFANSGFNSETTSNDSDMFYNFRNKMMHSYSRLYEHKNLMSSTIQNFEQIVLLIIERYPRRIG